VDLEDTSSPDRMGQRLRVQDEILDLVFHDFLPYRPPQCREDSMDEAIKYDQGKLRYDLIPPEALEELAAVYTMGAAKYGRTLEMSYEEIGQWVTKQITERGQLPVAQASVRIQEACAGPATIKPEGNPCAIPTEMSGRGVFARAATTKSLCSGTPSTESGSLRAPEIGDAGTKSTFLNTRNADKQTLSAESETPSIKGVGLWRSGGSLEGSWRTSSFCKGEGALSAGGISMPSRLFTLTIAIQRGGQEEFFAADATTALGCLEIAWGALNERFPTSKIPPLFGLQSCDDTGSSVILRITGDENWRLGMSWRRIFAAIMRHAWAWMRGEDRDSESGLPHLAHAAWGCFTLMAYGRGGLGQDDRPAITTAPVQPSPSSLFTVEESAALNAVVTKATKHEPYLDAHANLHGEPRS
jgi:hypothetical protein